MIKFIKTNIGIIALIVLSALVIIIFLLPVYFHFEYIANKDQNPIDEYTFSYYVLATLFALIITVIAYWQLKNINENLKADYLIKIDERWRSAEIIKARIIIHHLYLDAQELLKRQKISGKSQLREEIWNKIKELSESRSKENVEDFIYLLNFLDFMETVGYLHTQGHLQKESLDELFGASIEFNYEIFKIYISYRRKKHAIQDFYEEFMKLYDVIQIDRSNKRKIIK